MSPPRVLITHRPFPETVEMLAPYCDLDVNPTSETLPAAELMARAENADGLLVFMPDRIDARFLDGCPRLRAISAALKGYDNIDVSAAASRGIAVAIVDDLLTAPTAELGVALLLSAARRVGEGDRFVRSGRFRGWRPELYGLGLAGSTVGLLGFGAIGQAIARRLVGFDCTLLHTDPAVAADTPVSHHVDLDSLFSRCDAVIVSVPLTAQTTGMVGAGQLARLPSHAVLVNIGRGSVVDEDAVAAALADGTLGAYAADVYAFEDQTLPDRPAAVSQRLRAHDRTVLTPHLGSATVAARRSIERRAAQNLLRLLERRAAGT